MTLDFNVQAVSFRVRVTNPTSGPVVFQLADGSFGDARVELDASADGQALTLSFPLGTALGAAAGPRDPALGPATLVSRPGAFPTGFVGGESIELEGDVGTGSHWGPVVVEFGPDGHWPDPGKKKGSRIARDSAACSQGLCIAAINRAVGYTAASDADPGSGETTRRTVLRSLVEGPLGNIRVVSVSSPAVSTALGFAADDAAVGTGTPPAVVDGHRITFPAGATIIVEQQRWVRNPNGVTVGSATAPSPLAAVALPVIVDFAPRQRHERMLVVGSSAGGVFELS